MKIGKVRWVVMVLITVMVFNMSTCSARFGHKRKNGSNSNLPGSAIVLPVDGNVYPIGFYNVTLNIGQPPRPYFLDVDTGSDLTWLQCDAPCARCSETPHPLYRPSNYFVPCRDPICASLQSTEDYNCEDPNQCDYEIKYADDFSTLGVLLNDVYHLNFINERQLKVRMPLGCGYDQIFSPSSDHKLDGILGLGRGKASLISQLSSQGLVKNVIGHCLSSEGGGYISVGEFYVPEQLKWIPVSSVDSKHYSAGPSCLVLGRKKSGVGNLAVIFDSGSSYTYFNSHAYQALLSWLKKELSGKPLKEAPHDPRLLLCWRGERAFESIREIQQYFKPVTLSFTDAEGVEVPFLIPPKGYLIISNLGNVCLGILHYSEIGLGEMNLIGDISMQDKIMVFDNEKHVIGWVAQNCRRDLSEI